MREIISSIFCLIFGVVLWALSANYFEVAEPWSVSIPGYSIAIFIGGLIAALIAGKEFNRLAWLWPVLLVIGQLGYVLYSYDTGARIVFIITPLIAYSILSGLGSLLGVQITNK